MSLFLERAAALQCPRGISCNICSVALTAQVWVQKRTLFKLV